jgi:hypothetical protein
MTTLHPTAVALAKVEADYRDILAELATTKAIRRSLRARHRKAIIKAIADNPDATNVDLAARFGVTEGTVRNARRTITP